MAYTDNNDTDCSYLDWSVIWDTKIDEYFCIVDTKTLQDYECKVICSETESEVVNMKVSGLPYFCFKVNRNNTYFMIIKIIYGKFGSKSKCCYRVLNVKDYISDNFDQKTIFNTKPGFFNSILNKEYSNEELRERILSGRFTKKNRYMTLPVFKKIVDPKNELSNIFIEYLFEDFSNNIKPRKIQEIIKGIGNELLIELIISGNFLKDKHDIEGVLTYELFIKLFNSNLPIPSNIIDDIWYNKVLKLPQIIPELSNSELLVLLKNNMFKRYKHDPEKKLTFKKFDWLYDPCRDLSDKELMEEWNKRVLQVESDERILPEISNKKLIELIMEGKFERSYHDPEYRLSYELFKKIYDPEKEYFEGELLSIWYNSVEKYSKPDLTEQESDEFAKYSESESDSTEPESPRYNEEFEKDFGIQELEADITDSVIIDSLDELEKGNFESIKSILN